MALREGTLSPCCVTQKGHPSLRKSYARLAPRLSGRVGRYAHARQFKRMLKTERRLKGYTGGGKRDIQRQLGRAAGQQPSAADRGEVACMDRQLRQEPRDKGKARVRYKFGPKVPVTTTHKEDFVAGMRSMHVNSYDGHSLREALEQVKILTETRSTPAFVNRGDHSNGVETTAVYIAELRRGITPALQRDLRRRRAIERMIGHMKTDDCLASCALTGTFGDALHAVLCG